MIYRCHMYTVNIMTRTPWDQDSSRIMKGFLKRHGMTYEELADRLCEIGVEETVSGIKGKLGRGTFKLSWVLQVCRVTGVEEIKF